MAHNIDALRMSGCVEGSPIAVESSPSCGCAVAKNLEFGLHVLDGYPKRDGLWVGPALRSANRVGESEGCVSGSRFSIGLEGGVDPM